MADQKSQRLINVVVVLLSTSRYLDREEIRRRVEGYKDKDDDAFLRMFERDKEELRSMGIALLSGSNDPHDDEDDSYKIDGDAFFLPEIRLTREESTLIGLASTVWSHDEVAADVRHAIIKLQAAGESVGDVAQGVLAPRLTAREPAFSILWDSLMTRTPVKFMYHGSMRRVNPWRLMNRWGAWYLMCGMRDGREPVVRVFKLARMETLPTQISGTYAPPDPVMVSEKARELQPAQPTSEALLAVRLGVAAGLRRRGIPVDETAPTGYDLLRLPYGREDEVISTVVEAGSDVLVLAPQEIRDAVIERLREIVGRDHDGD